MLRLLLTTLRWTGLGWLWRFCHRRGIVILTIHGVAGPEASATWLPLRSRVSPVRLDECLTILQRVYTLVSLDEAVEMLAGRRPLQPRSLVITFDDGYRNHATRALPVLEKQRAPATVFVATGPVVSRQPFWFDRLDYALQLGVRTRKTIAVGGQMVTLDPSSRSTLAASFAALRSAAKSPLRDDRAMNHELAALADALEHDGRQHLADVFEADPWSAVLTVDELHAAAPALDFGSHTVDHLRVHRLDRESARAQLSESRQHLESWTGRPCRFFCYPDGGVSPESAALVRECGYAAAVTTQRGLNYRADDLMTLRRIDLPAEGTAAELLAEVSGLKDWLLGVRRRLETSVASPKSC